MCGISGCVTTKNNSTEIVLQSLNKLQNRGYDSVGLATIVDDDVLIKKFVTHSETGETPMSQLISDPTIQLVKHATIISIGHTRWATHGGKTIVNAHPHTATNNNIILVHNGIIENYLDLKSELIQCGYEFYGQTDTEVVAKYIEHQIHIHRETDLCKVLSNLNKILKGSRAIVLMDTNRSDRLYFMKNGSPLLLGYNSDKNIIMLTSELAGFDSAISYYYPLLDDDYGFISIEEIRTTFDYHIYQVPNMIIENSPEPFPYWTIKEIYDQPRAIEALLVQKLRCNLETQQLEVYFPELDNDFGKYLLDVEHIIFLACGTSYHAAK